MTNIFMPVWKDNDGNALIRVENREQIFARHEDAHRYVMDNFAVLARMGLEFDGVIELEVFDDKPAAYIVRDNVVLDHEIFGRIAVLSGPMFDSAEKGKPNGSR